MKLDKTYLEQQLIKLKQLSDQCELDNWDKLYYSNPYEKGIVKTKALLSFIDLPVKVDEYQDGLVIVNERFIFSLSSYKWKVKHKAKWYMSKGVKDFVERFVMK